MQPLVMTGRIDAPVARVFAAWCDPAVIQRWFAPGDMHVPEASADARRGGRYRIVMQAPDGKQYIVVGEYLHIQADRAIEFTWQWEGSEAITRVRIDLQPVDAGNTELTMTLTYQHLDAQQRESYRKVMAEFVPMWEGLKAQHAAA